MRQQTIDTMSLSDRRNVTPNTIRNIASIVITLPAISFLLFACDRPNGPVVVARMMNIPVNAINTKPITVYVYALFSYPPECVQPPIPQISAIQPDKTPTVAVNLRMLVIGYVATMLRFFAHGM